MEIWRQTSPVAFLLLAMMLAHDSRESNLVTKVSSTRSEGVIVLTICGSGVDTTANLSSLSKLHLMVIMESDDLIHGELDSLSYLHLF